LFFPCIFQLTCHKCISFGGAFFATPL
jgi:hypothetical protein